MKKKHYFVFYLLADGKYSNSFTISAVSFSDACKNANSFSKQAGVTILGVVEERALSDSSYSSNF